LVIATLSCGQFKNDNKYVSNKFIDIKGLIDHQVKLLDSIGPFLLKNAIINGAEEQININTDIDFSWENELSIFKSADINKPVLEDSYEIILKTNTRLKTVTYLSKTPLQTQVDSMAIIFTEFDNTPIQINVMMSNKNELFESARTLELTFKKSDSHFLLSSYNIEGWQKMIAKDTTNFSIVGTLNF